MGYWAWDIAAIKGAHTPGPWKVEHDGPSLPIITATINGRWDFVAKCDHANGADEANARLIAESPRMATAIRNLMAPFGHYIQKHAPSQYAELREILTKIEGGSCP